MGVRERQASPLPTSLGMHSQAFSSWLIVAAIALAASAAVTLGLATGPLASRTSQVESDDWRRTANGWERRSDWRPADSPQAQPTYCLARTPAGTSVSDGD